MLFQETCPFQLRKLSPKHRLFNVQIFKTLSLNQFECKNLMNKCVITMFIYMVFHIGNLNSNHHAGLADVFINVFIKTYLELKSPHFSNKVTIMSN